MQLRLLFAVPDANVCEVYRRFFGEHGYDVETAHSGLECLDKMRGRNPSAIVLDRDLLWGGWEGILDWMRQEPAFQKLPVVLLTSRAMVAGSMEFRQPPIVYCQKLEGLMLLLECIRVAVASSRAKESFNGLCNQEVRS